MHLIKKMCESGVDALSLDSPEAGIDLYEAPKRVSENIIVIGNTNPVGSLLNGTSDEVKEDVEQLLSRMAEFPNFVLSSGCDLPQETPVDNIKAFMQTGRNYQYT